MREYRVKKSGFTLLEVLIAAGILFIVGSATIGLTNSIIQGTNQTSSATVANRLASEGLELVTKIRDDTVKAGIGDAVWFDPAESYSNYGWYKVTSPTQLDSASYPTLAPTLQAITSDFSRDAVVKQTVGNQDYFRLICIEPVGAGHYTNGPLNDKTGCSVDNTGVVARDDGLRTDPNLTTCKPTDYYCKMTEASIERNRSGTHAIPPGNAVKVRSVVVWQDKDQYRAADLTTMLTDWKSKIDAAQN